MALTKVAGALGGATFRTIKGKNYEAELGGDRAFYIDGAGSGTTDGSGDIDIDLTATFSAIVGAIVVMQGTAGYYCSRDVAATAGHVKFRVFDGAIPSPVASTAVTYDYFVVGTPV